MPYFPHQYCQPYTFYRGFSGENAHPKFGVLISTTIISTTLVLAYLNITKRINLVCTVPELRGNCQCYSYGNLLYSPNEVPHALLCLNCSNTSLPQFSTAKVAIYMTANSNSVRRFHLHKAVFLISLSQHCFRANKKSLS